MKLSEEELKACETLPDVLAALADYHDAEAAMAEPMEYADSAEWHEQRANELRAEYRRIMKKWEE